MTTFSEAVREADRDVLCGALLSNRSFELVEKLSECGSRFPGTPSETRAISFLKEVMEDYGLSSVHSKPFNYTGWTRGEVSLTVGGRSFDAIALPHSPPTKIEGELVFVGYGTPSEFAAVAGQLRDKIVICDAKKPLYTGGKSMHRKDRYLRAVREGAAGFIWMRDRGGFLPETGSLYAGCTVPGVGVSRETGMQLVRMLGEEPVIARLEMDTTVSEMESANVVGELPGNGDSDQIVLVGGHYDGHDIGQGALDNATGVAIALEAARLLAPHAHLLRKSIRFVCFSAEELGLLGSSAYVQQIDEELDSIDFMLNLDGSPGRGGTLGVALQAWPELVQVFGRMFSEMKMSVVTDVAFKSSSDGYPFTLAGVPTGYFRAYDRQTTGRNWAHTAADTVDKVSPDDMIKDSMLVARMLLHVCAWPGEWPARRYTKEEVDALVGGMGARRVTLEESL